MELLRRRVLTVSDLISWESEVTRAADMNSAPGLTAYWRASSRTTKKDTLARLRLTALGRAYVGGIQKSVFPRKRSPRVMLFCRRQRGTRPPRPSGAFHDLSRASVSGLRRLCWPRHRRAVHAAHVVPREYVAQSVNPDSAVQTRRTMLELHLGHFATPTLALRSCGKRGPQAIKTTRTCDLEMCESRME